MNAPRPITAFIVDDEALAREAIRLRLKNEADIEVIGEADDGPSAVKHIDELRPDLLFLDVQMPEMNGFDVIERIAPSHLPIVVFVTAYDQYALRAFETHALDYLLKPFTAKRFETALDRARLEVAKSGDAETHRQLLSLLRERAPAQAPVAENPKQYLTRLTVKHDHRITLVRVEDIDWIESSANYACLHLGSSTYVVRMTMSELERRLDPARFARIHRSSIVQIDRIKEIVPAWHGDFDLTLRDGTLLRLTRNYRSRLLQ
jgi:two-component system LytT family response regulator